MSKKSKIILILLPVAVVIALLSWYLSKHNVAVLSPAGEVGRKERDLIRFAIILSAIVVLPVFALTIFIAVKYNENNKHSKVKYTPDWDHSRLFESIWWGIPMIIIAVLSVVTWTSSHSLDPYKALSYKTPAIPVEVIAMDWKWLFIYPNEGIACVNQLNIPVNTPVDFYITSDSVMNSFWIPRLGGQIYAMPGMSTQLHLIANKLGSYYGSSANISGVGFAGMHFKTIAMTNANFAGWVSSAQDSYNYLNLNNYNQLAQPSQNNSVVYYSDIANNLFDKVVESFTSPAYQGINN